MEKFLRTYMEMLMEPSEKLKRFGGIVEENKIIYRIFAEIEKQQGQNSKYIDEIISKADYMQLLFLCLEVPVDDLNAWFADPTVDKAYEILLNYLKGLPIAEIVKFSAKIQNFILTSIPLESLFEKVKNAQWSDITKLNAYVQIDLVEKMMDSPEGKEIFNNKNVDFNDISQLVAVIQDCFIDIMSPEILNEKTKDVSWDDIYKLSKFGQDSLFKKLSKLPDAHFFKRNDFNIDNIKKLSGQQAKKLLMDKWNQLTPGKESIISDISDYDEPKEQEPEAPGEEEINSKPSIKSRINESISKSDSLNQNEPNIPNPDLDCK